MNYNNLCYRCFCEKPAREKACPNCGSKSTPAPPSANCLLPGSIIHNRYIVGETLGVGGFGITYKCFDREIGGICAIKEYFPANLAVRRNASRFVFVEEQNIGRYNEVLSRFVEEARLVRELRHRNVITVYDSFFENNTAYYVMEYCDGVDLRRYTNNFTRKLEYGEGMNLLYQIMNGLEYIHSKEILHRDIAPDNIYITRNNSVKILDFGSARREMEQYNKELSVIVKVGYAPVEQYGGNGKQGPYTDIYALGATFYHLFTSRMPLESTQRVAGDTLEPFSRLRPDLPDNLKYCIEKAMSISATNRISNIAEMKRILGIVNTSERPPIKKQPAKRTPIKRGTKRILEANAGWYAGKATGQNRKTASIASRIGAYTIDLLLWSVIYFGILFGVLGVNTASIWMSLPFPIVFMLINTISELMTSTTIGKAIFNMHVRNRDGTEASPGQILLRNLIKLLGIFVVAFSRNNELLEDRATNTVVRKEE